MPKNYHFATGRLREKLRPIDLRLIRPRCLSWVKSVVLCNRRLPETMNGLYLGLDQQDPAIELIRNLAGHALP
jgi:hypothetical protein